MLPAANAERNVSVDAQETSGSPIQPTTDEDDDDDATRERNSLAHRTSEMCTMHMHMHTACGDDDGGGGGGGDDDDDDDGSDSDDSGGSDDAITPQNPAPHGTINTQRMLSRRNFIHSFVHMIDSVVHMIDSQLHSFIHSFIHMIDSVIHMIDSFHPSIPSWCRWTMDFFYWHHFLLHVCLWWCYLHMHACFQLMGGVGWLVIKGHQITLRSSQEGAGLLETFFAHDPAAKSLFLDHHQETSGVFVTIDASQASHAFDPGLGFVLSFCPPNFSG
jgi:hypothetical protein